MPRPDFDSINHPRYKPRDFITAGTFVIIDAYIGLGASAVFLVENQTTKEKYEVSFKDIKSHLNGVQINGTISVGSSAYHFKFK